MPPFVAWTSPRLLKPLTRLPLILDPVIVAEAPGNSVIRIPPAFASI
jgi:hypothetical protein